MTNYGAKAHNYLHDLDLLATHRDELGGRIPNVTDSLDLSLDSKKSAILASMKIASDSASV